jgi:hypothetical protein
VPADRLHLVRHGEVHNPDRCCTGDCRTSAECRRARDGAAAPPSGTRTARVGALRLAAAAHAESAEPFTAAFGLEPVIDERVIEPTNVFEGKRMRRAVLNPSTGASADPAIPSWGEPYPRSSSAWMPR